MAMISMSSTKLPGKGKIPFGVHPPDRKELSAGVPIEVVPAPQQVLLPLQQHLGAPSGDVAKPRQEVAFGEKVAKGQAFVSANLHTPIAGVVQRPASVTLPNGRHVKAIPIKAEGEQLSGRELWEEIYGGDTSRDGIETYDPEKIGEAVHEAGIVGMGGAAFPSHVKLIRNEKKPVDALLINGCECEPYLTSDDSLMIEAPGPVITGALLVARAIGAKSTYVGLESDTPRAIEVMRKAAAGTGIVIAALKTKYPQGAEKNLIKAILDREVPPGGLPMDVGAAVVNVGTAAAIARAVISGKPLTHRIVCVTGAGIQHPKNLLVPIGISFGELIDYCGGLKEDAARLVAGGPMMGFAFADVSTVVTKGTSGLTVLTRDDIARETETECIHCGQCVRACPMRLVPAKIGQAAKYKDWELAQKYHIMDCYECGSCTYTCPAKVPLMQLIRTGKAEVARLEREKGS